MCYKNIEHTTLITTASEALFYLVNSTDPEIRRSRLNLIEGTGCWRLRQKGGKCGFVVWHSTIEHQGQLVKQCARVPYRWHP